MNEIFKEQKLTSALSSLIKFLTFQKLSEILQEFKKFQLFFILISNAHALFSIQFLRDDDDDSSKGLRILQRAFLSVKLLTDTKNFHVTIFSFILWLFTFKLPLKLLRVNMMSLTLKEKTAWISKILLCWKFAYHFTGLDRERRMKRKFRLCSMAH